jgi:hypothetical protein
VVPESDFDAGGRLKWKHYFGYLWDKGGVVGDISSALRDMVAGSPWTTWDDKTLPENIQRSAVGFKRFLRISDRGYSERQWYLRELDDQMDRQFRGRLPIDVRKRMKEYFSLLHTEDRTKSQETRFQQVKDWYYGSYRVISPALREAQEYGLDSEESKQLREKLKGTAADLETLDWQTREDLQFRAGLLKQEEDAGKGPPEGRDMALKLQVLVQPKPMTLTRTDKRKGVSIGEKQQEYAYNQKLARRWFKTNKVSIEAALSSYREHLIQQSRDRGTKRVDFARVNQKVNRARRALTSSQ